MILKSDKQSFSETRKYHLLVLCNELPMNMPMNYKYRKQSALCCVKPLCSVMLKRQRTTSTELKENNASTDYVEADRFSSCMCAK